MPSAIVDLQSVLYTPGTSPRPLTVPRCGNMLTLGGFVGGSVGAGVGDGTETFPCSSASGRTDEGLDNVCSESLGGSIRTLKTVNYSEGDAPNAVEVYGAQVRGTVKYSTVFRWFHLSESLIRPPGHLSA